MWYVALHYKYWLQLGPLVKCLVFWCNTGLVFSLCAREVAMEITKNSHLTWAGPLFVSGCIIKLVSAIVVWFKGLRYKIVAMKIFLYERSTFVKLLNSCLEFWSPSTIHPDLTLSSVLMRDQHVKVYLFCSVVKVKSNITPAQTMNSRYNTHLWWLTG
jgi:hypothetical protein